MHLMNKLTLLFPLFISGCVSLNPTYNQPKGMTPDKMPTTGIYENPLNSPVTQKELYWENYVINTKLKTVISQSLNNNRDLKIAVSNIEAAKAQYGITDSARLPTLSAGLSGAKSKNMDNVSEQYQADFGISSFELDFFGRVKSLSDSALESFLSTQESQRATKLLVISETAKAYVTVALYKSQLLIAQKTEKSRSESLKLIRIKVESGISNPKDLSDIESTYYLAKADVYNYQTQVEQSINALTLLVGSTIDGALLPERLSELNESFKNANFEITSDILAKRPDVLSAEHQLLASNANIGAARAAFFPRITLTTSKGVASSQLSFLFNNGSNVWNFSPSLSIPIFDYGYNKSNLKYSKAQNDISVATYEKSVQTAFKEVADELARKGTINNQVDSYLKYVEATRNSFDLASKSYEVGISDYLTVLTAQNTLYNAEKMSIILEQERLNNIINFYKVIGF